MPCLARFSAGGRGQPKPAKLKRVSKLSKQEVSGCACGGHATAMVSRDGKLYMFGSLEDDLVDKSSGECVAKMFCQWEMIHVGKALISPTFILYYINYYIVNGKNPGGGSKSGGISRGPSLCIKPWCACTGSSVGRALCLEYRVSWVRVPPEAAHFF